MVVLVSFLAIGMIASGISAIAFGSTIIQVERGWTMVISGSVGASSGAILLGIALVAQRLGRIARETVLVRERLAQIEELTALAVADVPVATMEPDFIPPAPDPVLAIREPAEPRQEATIVGRYASGGSSYVMYGDGSIQAEFPDGPRRFGSIEELRSFVATSARG